MLPVVLAVLVLEMVAVLWLRFGLGQAVLCCNILGMAVYPQLLTDRPSAVNIGIAGPAPELRTFTVCVLAGVICMLLRHGRTPVSLSYVPFVLWLAWSAIAYWQRTPEQWAGIVHLTVGVLAWALGTAVRRARDDSCGWNLALLVALIVLGQSFVCVMQLVGLPINALSTNESVILGNRTNGTLNHPDNLGKVLVLLMVLVLPLTKSGDRATRRLATSSLFLSFLPLALAQGRANLISALAVILFWVLVQPRDSPVNGARVIIAGGLAAAAGGLIIIASRFQADPTGGVRSDLTATALRHLPDLLAHGTGPNSYVTYIAPLSGSYIPVHNSYLLLTAELGLIGAISFLFPHMWSLRQAAFLRLDTGARGDSARALLVLIVPLALIGGTGWGLLGTSVLSLWLFVTGYHTAGMRADIRETTAATSPPLDITKRIRTARKSHLI